ncbi:MAG: hypothetical protein ABR915_22955 [Thermoguttaceae bacterium]|jgi:hypothetical protein
MAQLLALEWDRAEVRIVVAAKHGRDTVIERAFAIPLPTAPPGAQLGAADIGRLIAEALAQWDLGHAEALVAVGRRSIQLREFQLPAVPDAELPEMVRLQAMHDLADLDDSWLLDFLPIEGVPPLAPAEGSQAAPGTGDAATGPDSRTVLAAVLEPDLVAQIRAVCEAAGLRLGRIVLRACEAAWLLSRGKGDSPISGLSVRTGERKSGQSPARFSAGPCLVIDLLDGEADLTALAGGQVVYLRNTRVYKANLEEAMLLEIRRTMAAVQNRLRGRRIESVVFCGAGGPQAALARIVHEQLAVATELFDPFDSFELGTELRQSPPEHPGRFAPLVGAAVAELDAAGHAIDFLHPRRAPAPPSRRKKWIAAAVAAAVLLLGYLIYARIDRAMLAAEIEQLQKDAPSLEKQAAAADKVRAAAADISKWTDSDIVWLDHFRALSEQFPSARGAVVNQLTFSSSAGGGEIRLRGLARDHAAIGQMEQQLGGRSRGVIDRGSHEDPSQGPYSWRFETSVLVGREPP